MEIPYLFGAIGNRGHVCRNLAQRGVLMRQPLVDFPDVFLDPTLDLMGGIFELTGDPRSFFQERGRHWKRLESEADGDGGVGGGEISEGKETDLTPDKGPA